MKHALRYKIIIFLLIAVISTLHYLTGTIASPIHSFFRLLYFIPIILASFNFGFRGGIISSITVSLIYSPNMLLSLNFSKDTVSELLDIVLFFTVGIITGTLVEKKNLSLARLDSELKRYSLLENYSKSIFESIKSGIIAVNNDMLITTINQGAMEILAAEYEYSGQNLFEVLPCCENIKDKIIASLQDNKINENIEETLKAKDKEIILNISIFPLNYEGNTKGLVIIIDDITELKRLQRQIYRNDRLAALGELSAGIAHEIRNPLAIIKIIGQTLKNELKQNNEVINELDMLDEEVERANRVVKALMEFGKPSKNERIYVSLNQVLEEVLIITGKYLSSHKVDIKFQKGDIDTSFVDKEQLKQAFVNIIFNAVEAMPEGGKLEIATQMQDESFIKVIFKDNGIGIRKEDIDKIFNPFFTTRDEGTGLGLSIVHRIIEDHHGKINVTSSVGEGTIFEILFPVEKE